MHVIVRQLPLESQDGATLMAGDEVILEGAVGGTASLRFYTWAAPTLTLGYFQPASERRPNLPWIRRASGGAALIHHHELTYGLALPAGFPWQRRGESWICRMHSIIARALGRLGVPLHPVQCQSERKLGPVLCFLHHTPGDLLLADHKIVGSAQRKSRGALMQHGGILLAQSPLAPELPGIQELTGRVLDPTSLVEAIHIEFQADTGWLLQPGDWTNWERQRIRELVETKYATPTWNEKR
jgi:lipoate-protein ligase A